jgi:hypothetical protein
LISTAWRNCSPRYADTEAFLAELDLERHWTMDYGLREEHR